MAIPLDLNSNNKVQFLRSERYEKKKSDQIKSQKNDFDLIFHNFRNFKNDLIWS